MDQHDLKPVREYVVTATSKSGYTHYLGAYGVFKSDLRKATTFPKRKDAEQVAKVQKFRFTTGTSIKVERL